MKTVKELYKEREELAIKALKQNKRVRAILHFINTCSPFDDREASLLNEKIEEEYELLDYIKKEHKRISIALGDWKESN